LSPATSDSSNTALDTKVDLVEALGSELLVHFQIDAKRVLAEGVQDDVAAESGPGQLEVRGEGVARVDPRLTVKVGDRLRLEVDIDRMQFFDPTTGEAVWE